MKRLALVLLVAMLAGCTNPRTELIDGKLVSLSGWVVGFGVPDPEILSSQDDWEEYEQNHLTCGPPILYDRGNYTDPGIAPEPPPDDFIRDECLPPTVDYETSNLIALTTSQATKVELLQIKKRGSVIYVYLRESCFGWLLTSLPELYTIEIPAQPKSASVKVAVSESGDCVEPYPEPRPL